MWIPSTCVGTLTMRPPWMASCGSGISTPRARIVSTARSMSRTPNVIPQTRPAAEFSSGSGGPTISSTVEPTLQKTYLLVFRSRARGLSRNTRPITLRRCVGVADHEHEMVDMLGAVGLLGVVARVPLFQDRYRTGGERRGRGSVTCYRHDSTGNPRRRCSRRGCGIAPGHGNPMSIRPARHPTSRLRSAISRSGACGRPGSGRSTRTPPSVSSTSKARHPW